MNINTQFTKARRKKLPAPTRLTAARAPQPCKTRLRWRQLKPRKLYEKSRSNGARLHQEQKESGSFTRKWKESREATELQQLRPHVVCTSLECPHTTPWLVHLRQLHSILHRQASRSQSSCGPIAIQEATKSLDECSMAHGGRMPARKHAWIEDSRWSAGGGGGAEEEEPN
jgi:hypothetical protein